MSSAILATAPEIDLPQRDWARQIKILGGTLLVVFLISLALSQPAVSESCAGTAMTVSDIILPDTPRTA
ncbi:MAG: hypothetical protein OEN23_07650 [Paracoccaceae bacterium]|nr:hypothetical protein [Paracoccaceae bacterium]